MENAFLELYEEVRKLQIICSKQADLLQELLSKKDHVTEMPVSKPIQCTDTGDDVCSESPFFRLKGKEDQCVEAIKTQADDVPVPLETEENPSLLLDIDVRFPPCEDQYNFLASVPDKEETAVGLPCAEFTSDEVNSNYALFIKNDTPKFLNMDNNGSKIAPAGVYLDFLTPVNIEHNFSLSNIYQEDIRFLQSTDISFEALLEPHKNFNEVKGPAQSSWSPGCLSEDFPCSQHVDVNSDVGLSSQICEFCHAVFPAGAATGGEFLGHLAGHME
ncbi:TRAF family member-associated NF-kappa-B activator-like isoform X1 [Bufo gargarizans]|uniref:TRAF family member-associated NF-kappa-B activator-like isoform X1 n=1 Tax=Bufo gargarizans TaxID=30331 RepID=UPI001CF417B7|nr:TRAF family member-associated NF-kappa-B activator-like isoform X1 [Bufo gargarizans]XP_044144192.1 TRAF family member-associated NF-kappa-B activator-like isoform X1 [Bufo gargarizans]XP_044144193.1 TRAF family member-associated NF-kappa-B activator-like isoform X1 [Bufo gargarizans]XP_044144194.1 TRAF family member-associated NF-kappa-B activator-like isoform X1 [Bufo gargarizans]XP_044144195.1 TRAF family member-associated NF-kappa-B activator-like isoform X1 [Bufo gargarizans]